MRFILAAAVLLLAGCETAPKRDARIETRMVEVPIRESCIPATLPAAPPYSDDDLKSEPDPAKRLLKVGAANQERRARLAALEPVVEACR